jgi:large-conductance mechanosensitive channel
MMSNNNRSRYENVIKFILSEKFLTIAVIGSVITFQFISTFKMNIIDPLLDFALPQDKFSFMDITIREGDEIAPPNPKLSLGIGLFFREFIKFCVSIVILYLIAKYTKFPDTPGGNFTGAAIM